MQTCWQTGSWRNWKPYLGASTVLVLQRCHSVLYWLHLLSCFLTGYIRQLTCAYFVVLAVVSNLVLVFIRFLNHTNAIRQSQVTTLLELLYTLVFIYEGVYRYSYTTLKFADNTSYNIRSGSGNPYQKCIIYLLFTFCMFWSHNWDNYHSAYARVSQTYTQWPLSHSGSWYHRLWKISKGAVGYRGGSV